MSAFPLETAAQARRAAPRRHRARVARRGPRQGHAADGRGRPRPAGAAAHRRVPRLREVHPGPSVLGSAGHGAAAVRHLPGEPPPRGLQGARPGGGRDDAHAHGREDPPPDALRPDPAVARAALLPPLVARPAVRFRLGHGPPQHRRRGGRASGNREAGRAAAEVRPGSHPPHRGQAHPRHRRGPRRRQQEPDRRRARRAEEGRLPDDRVEPRRGAPGAPALRAGPGHVPQLRHVSRPAR